MTTPQNFRDALKGFAKTVRKRQDRVVQVLAEFCFVSTRNMTPVWSGRARGSWRVAAGSPDKSTEAATNVPLSIPEPPIPGIVSALEAGGLVWVTNSVPYALDLEHANPREYGTFVKGSHMVATTAGRAPSVWPGLVRRAREVTP